MQKFSANGKLLLTAEYLVLDGARALAVPTRLGQTLQVQTSPSNQRKLEWKSFNHDGSLWFEALFDKNLQVIHTSNREVAERLQKLMGFAVQLNPSFYADALWYEVETHLEFHREWGLGSSSTLVSLVARWADVDWYELLQNTFGGSGYDVACATATGPITYRLENGKPVVEAVDFSPSFQDKLRFLYTGQKQLSNKEVTRYRDLTFDKTSAVAKVNTLTQALLKATSLEEFQKVLDDHESVLSGILNLPKAKNTLLPNYGGSVKSLGAWGGDFVLLAGESMEGDIPYAEMVLNAKPT